MTERPFDTVIVPDFRPGRAALFEGRALLFLACWSAYAGGAREWPLHVVCIGEPPETVRRAAKRAGASLAVKEPIDAELRGTSNKIRGLETPARTGRIFLLDADAFPLGDLSDLAAAGEGVALSPALQPRIPEETWPEIYGLLGLEEPEERIVSIRAELDCPRQSRSVRWDRSLPHRSIHPYYSGGAVLLPADGGLRELWEENIRRIRAAFGDGGRRGRAFSESDQAGLAAAVQALRARGVPVRRLPDHFHANWLHLFRGTIPPEEIRVFHAHKIFRGGAAGGPRSGPARYGSFLAAGMLVEAWRQDIARLRPDRAARDIPRGLAGARFVAGRLVRAWNRFVVEEKVPRK